MNAAILPGALSAADRALLAEVQHGLPLVSEPYAVIGARLGWSQQRVIDRLRALLESGVIKRWGVVVRHHELGYRANAMVVWDVPDEQTEDLGRAFAEFEFVTLSYRRPRRPPDWPYNLFCMIHGRDRVTVSAQVQHLVDKLALAAIPHAVLFSGRRFKQRGACYFAPPPARASR